MWNSQTVLTCIENLQTGFAQSNLHATSVAWNVDETKLQLSCMVLSSLQHTLNSSETRAQQLQNSQLCGTSFMQ